MHRSSSELCILVGLIAAFLPAAPASAQEGQSEPEKDVRTAGVYAIDQLLQFSYVDGWLSVKCMQPANWPAGHALRPTITGSSAIWTWRTSSRQDNVAGGSTMVTELWYREIGNEQQEGFTRASIYSRGGYLAITGIVRYGGNTVSITYRGREDAQSVNLEAYIQEDGELTQNLVDAQGRSLEEIRAQHQREVDVLLAPLLLKLAQHNVIGPGAGDVYRVFREITPDASIRSRVEAILPKLDSPDAAQRDGASEQLMMLGRPAVLAALRLNGAGLSPEQRARLARLITAHQYRQLELANGSKPALPLLIECLRDEDPAVRAAAAQAIHASIGHAVEFDPGDPFEARETAIAQCRKAMESEPQPVEETASK